MTESKKYYIFNGGIDKDPVNTLIDYINNNPGNITISFTSTGGDMEMGRFLVHALNDNADRITLVAVNWIYSCAFKIFHSFKGKRMITFGCGGMFHYTSLNMSMTYDNKPNYEYEGAAQIASMKECKKENLNFCKTFMTDKELDLYKQNRDVHFSFPRMRQIFKDVEII